MQQQRLSTRITMSSRSNKKGTRKSKSNKRKASEEHQSPVEKAGATCTTKVSRRSDSAGSDACWSSCFPTHSPFSLCLSCTGCEQEQELMQAEAAAADAKQVICTSSGGRWGARGCIRTVVAHRRLLVRAWISCVRAPLLLQRAAAAAAAAAAARPSAARARRARASWMNPRLRPRRSEASALCHCVQFVLHVLLLTQPSCCSSRASLPRAATVPIFSTLSCR
jgi:hypothetical protein